MNRANVVITGIGAVAANGMNVDEFYINSIKGISGIATSSIMKDFDYMTEYVGEIKLEYNARWESKFKMIGTMACNEMLRDSGLTSADIEQLEERAILCMATANVGSLRLEPQLIMKNQYNIEGCNYKLSEFKKNNMDVLDFNSSDCFFYFADLLGVRGAVLSSNVACASSTTAIGEATRMIELGKADVAIVAGIDVLSDLSLAGFNVLNNMSIKPCKPFDKKRSGITIGEGAGFILLESEEYAKKRDAKIYGVILGYATLNEGYHVTAPDPSGDGVKRCLDILYEKGDIGDTNCLYINTHGTGTVVNDAMELKGIEKFLQDKEFDKVYFSSTKSMIGHCLGASGALEFICSVKGLVSGAMPLSISVDEAMNFDADKLVLVDTKEKSKAYDAFISNSFAFAGNMVSILVQRY